MALRRAAPLIAVLLALHLFGTALAQDAPVDATASDTADTPAMVAPDPTDNTAVAPDATDGTAVPPDNGPPAPVITVSATDDNLQVPLATTEFALSGVTLPGAVLSADGQVIDVDDQGGFSTTIGLDEGINPVDLVASTPDGQTVTTTVYIIRGDA